MIEEVFPKYLAYHANKRHCIIDTRKEKDRLHRIEKRIRAGLDPNEPDEEPEPEEEVKKAPIKPASNKKVEVVEELPPRPTDEDEKSMKEYGVSNEPFLMLIQNCLTSVTHIVYFNRV